MQCKRLLLYAEKYFKQEKEKAENKVRLFDKCLQKYEEVYKKAGIDIKKFSDVDDFVADYLEDRGM